MVVYLDLVMLLNFLVDFLLLLGTNRLAVFPAGIKRCALAALLGAVYSGSCMLPGLYFLGNSLWRMVHLALMASVAFGWNRSSLRRSVVFVLLSMALGGMAVNLGTGSFGTLVLSGLGIWILCRVGFAGRMGQEYVQIQIWEDGRNLQLMALKDTGNTLRDPITGESVVVVGADLAWKLTGLTERDLTSPMETMLKYPGFRLIPYHAVGQTQGMLLAKPYQDVQIGNYRGRVLLAFAPEKIDGGGHYQALAGGML